MKNWLFKYNPFYVFLEYWDIQEKKWNLTRLNIFKGLVICSMYKENIKYVPRKNIVFD